ncbi:hypothetical protein CBL_07411 [Carabus blaptoides fortunei]
MELARKHSRRYVLNLHTICYSARSPNNGITNRTDLHGPLFSCSPHTHILNNDIHLFSDSGPCTLVAVHVDAMLFPVSVCIHLFVHVMEEHENNNCQRISFRATRRNKCGSTTFDAMMYL